MKITKGWLATIIIVCVILLDQFTKIWVKTHFFYGEEYVITDWFRLYFIENNGMAFGMEFGSKMLLTWFRIIAVILFIYYLYKIRNSKLLQKGYVVCVSLITAGALGNVLDCIFYGVIFDNPMPPFTATLFPEGGGYGTLFLGRVVDMLYFPLVEWNWPDWLPWIGGDHFIFFQPIFNVADAALSVGVILLILFYSKNFYQQEVDESKSDSESKK
ncbi:MAG: lipoprotein signal peptidase [Muribaculaceae bacterium]|jgi:signal peptidase II|nr:lipoprotein signal peptidase [Muribaculaceae bacterium]MEE1338357.1 lipoprotein signal peptidase [Muribaculaceae bacterium]